MFFFIFYQFSCRNENSYFFSAWAMASPMRVGEVETTTPHSFKILILSSALPLPP